MEVVAAAGSPRILLGLFWLVARVSTSYKPSEDAPSSSSSPLIGPTIPKEQGNILDINIEHDAFARESAD